MDANGPYQWTDDLPARNQIVRVANALDSDDREIARATEFRVVDDWVRRTKTSLGAATRFAAVVEQLSHFAGSGMDPVPVLERLGTLAAAAEFNERDAIRA